MLDIESNLIEKPKLSQYKKRPRILHEATTLQRFLISNDQYWQVHMSLVLRMYVAVAGKFKTF